MTGGEWQWSVLEVQCDGAPTLIRRNDTAELWSAHPALPIKLGFAVPLNAPNPGGLPDPNENKLLDALEDEICRRVEAAVTGIHAMTIANGQMKEFIFYVSLGADFETLHRAVQASTPTHQVHCMAVNEPEWETFQAFRTS